MMMFLARSLSSGFSVKVWSCSAIWIAPSWCLIMSSMNCLSSSAPLRASSGRIIGM